MCWGVGGGSYHPPNIPPHPVGGIVDRWGGGGVWGGGVNDHTDGGNLDKFGLALY